MIGDFTDWAKDIREQVAGLTVDIELEQFGGDPVDGIYGRLEDLLETSDYMVKVAKQHDEDYDTDLENIEGDGLVKGVTNTLIRRLEGIVRDLEFHNPNSPLLLDLTDAVVGFYNDEALPDLIVMGRVS